MNLDGWTVTRVRCGSCGAKMLRDPKAPIGKMSTLRCTCGRTFGLAGLAHVKRALQTVR